MSAELTRPWSMRHYVPEPGRHYRRDEAIDLVFQDEVIAYIIDGVKLGEVSDAQSFFNFAPDVVFAWLRDKEGLKLHKIR